MSTNRPIKFRVWDTQNAKYLEPTVMWSVAEVPENWMPGYPPWIPFLMLAIHSPVDKYVVEQFAGLLDKDGKEIYEGDIVKWGILGDDAMRYVVHYGKYVDGEGENHLGFYLESARADWRAGSILEMSPIEVFGNIHETPV